MVFTFFVSKNSQFSLKTTYLRVKRLFVKNLCMRTLPQRLVACVYFLSIRVFHGRWLRWNSCYFEISWPEDIFQRIYRLRLTFQNDQPTQRVRTPTLQCVQWMLMTWLRTCHQNDSSPTSAYRNFNSILGVPQDVTIPEIYCGYQKDPNRLQLMLYVVFQISLQLVFWMGFWVGLLRLKDPQL